MARKATNGGVNKSEEVRKVLAEKPNATAAEVVAELKEKGVEVNAGLFYSVKASMKQNRGRPRTPQKSVAQVVSSSSGAASNGAASNDAVSTIRKVKALAAEVGGLQKLQELVQALSE